MRKTMLMLLILLALAWLGNYSMPDPDRRVDNLARARADLASLKNGINMYLLQSNAKDLPTWVTLITPDERGTVWLEGYSEPPKDPWGNEYALLPWNRGVPDFEVQSWGPDGLQDTEDDLSARR